MPYPKSHKAETRARIVEAARVLFNRHGYDRTSIDDVMAEAGLTRGGFYAHFPNKEALFAEATASFLHGRGAQWRSEAGVDPVRREVVMVQRMVEAYLSRNHLDDVDGHCPLIAYATDVVRAGPAVQESYRQLAEAMTGLFEANLGEDAGDNRQKALSLTAICVGGMILARTLPHTQIGEEVRVAALEAASAVWKEAPRKMASDNDGDKQNIEYAR